jgi:succinate-semialdehyde dehydrogenase/glutarate-semialdehyde dehydrogenase
MGAGGFCGSRWPTTPPPFPPPLAEEGREGVAAYFYSRDIGRIWRVAEALEYGIVGINEGIISPKSHWRDRALRRHEGKRHRPLLAVHWGSKYGIEEFREVQ